VTGGRRSGHGDLINRRQVAAALGISTAPVHEAMAQLEAEGLLEALPRKGTRVRRALPHDVKDILIVREALDKLACRASGPQDLVNPLWFRPEPHRIEMRVQNDVYGQFQKRLAITTPSRRSHTRTAE
jgi:DNA-binding transcriptional MocR family regulator